MNSLTMLQMAISVLSLLGIGVCIGMVRANYVTQKQLKEHEERCWKSITRQFSEVNENRRSVWNKIDKIYDHLLEQKQ
jgi:hypothetical protein